MNEAYRLSKLMEKSITASDTLKSEHKYERRSLAERWNVATDSLADKKDHWAAIRSVLKSEEVQSYINKEKLMAPKDFASERQYKKTSCRKKGLAGFLCRRYIPD